MSRLIETLVGSLITMRYKLGYSPSPERFMSFAINIGTASVKAEVNILVSYSPFEKGVTRDEMISSKTLGLFLAGYGYAESDWEEKCMSNVVWFERERNNAVWKHSCASLRWRLAKYNNWMALWIRAGNTAYSNCFAWYRDRTLPLINWNWQRSLSLSLRLH